MLIFDMVGISNDPRLLCRWGGKRRYMLIFDMVGISNDPRLLCRWGGKRRLRWYNHNHLRQWASSISVTCYREVGWFALWFISQKELIWAVSLSLEIDLASHIAIGPSTQWQGTEWKKPCTQVIYRWRGYEAEWKDMGRYRKLPFMYPPNTSAVCTQRLLHWQISLFTKTE